MGDHADGNGIAGVSDGKVFPRAVHLFFHFRCFALEDFQEVFIQNGFCCNASGEFCHAVRVCDVGNVRSQTFRNQQIAGTKASQTEAFGECSCNNEIFVFI